MSAMVVRGMIHRTPRPVIVVAMRAWVRWRQGSHDDRYVFEVVVVMVMVMMVDMEVSGV